MKHFNLYHGSSRLNRRPLTEEELEMIIKKNLPIKKMKDNQLVDIPLNKIRIVKCTIV